MDNLDFNDAWEKINREKFSFSSIKKEEIMDAISKESSLTVSQLKKGLTHKLYWVLFFILLFTGVLLFNLNNPLIIGLASFMLVIYLIGGYGLYQQINKMDDQIDSSKDTLAEMKKHRALVKNALDSERKWGIITFPIISIAVLIYQKMKDGIPFKEFMTDPYFLTLMIVMTIGVSFLGIWIGKKMNKTAYGGFMDDLQENIEKMEGLN